MQHTYNIIRLLGEGGESPVYLGEDENGTRFAMKYIRRGSTEIEFAMEHLAEASNFLPQFHGVQRVNGQRMILYELMGPNVWDIFAKKKSPLSTNCAA